MAPTLPLLYTHVMGSHGFPGWFWTALDKIKAGEYGCRIGVPGAAGVRVW